MMKLFRRNRKGFTLVELVVVIAILGILAAIAVPRFLGSLDTAEENADQSTLAAVSSAVSLFFMENGTYPADTDALIAAGYIDNVSLNNYDEINIDANGECTLVNNP
jgi:type IV pilus assembly protein PilA